jgi:uncharacterized protein (TIGR02444 family)
MSGRAERLEKEFWEFSEARYQLEPVKEACLRLQNEFGLSVNMLLFCLWLAESQRQALSVEFVTQESSEFNRFDREALQPFRAKRMEAKDDENGDWLYQSLLNMELSLEEQAQALLIKAMLSSRSLERVVNNAEVQSLRVYLATKGLAMEGDLVALCKTLITVKE